MSTPDYPDWAQPVAQIEQAANLLNMNAISMDDGQTPSFQTSRYQTLIIDLLPGAPAQSSSVALQIAWVDAFNVSNVEIITCWNTNNTPGPGGIHCRIPVKGISCTMNVLTNGAAGQVAALNVAGSTRPVAPPTCTEAGANTARLLVNTGTINVGAGATSNFSFGPVARAISVLVWAAAATARGTISGVSGTSIGFTTDLVGLWVPNASFVFIPELILPFTAMTFGLNNNTGAAMNMLGHVWDVS